MIIPGSHTQLGGLEGSTKWNREMGAKQKEGQGHLARKQSKDQLPVADGEGGEKEEMVRKRP